MKIYKKATNERYYGYVTGALLGLLSPALVIVLIAARTEEVPRVVSVWPLLAAAGISVVTWWIQGLTYAVLARPHLKHTRVGEMIRVEMLGLFVVLVSPIRGAELPCKAYLLGRLGLSAGEGGSVVVTRVLLDVVILTPASLVALALSSAALPQIHNPNVLLAGLTTAVVLATVTFLVRRRVRGRSAKRTSRLGGSSWQAKAGVKVSTFLRDMRRSSASYWRPGQRANLIYAVTFTSVYWVLRLSVGPLALMAVGWTGDWLPVVVAQLLLASFVLPFAPTPGGGGVRELGLAALLSAYVPEAQLLSGLLVYTALSYWLPLVASVFFAGRELRRVTFRRNGERKTAERTDHSEATTQVLPTLALAALSRHFVWSGNPESGKARTRLHSEASTPTGRTPEENGA